MLQKLLIMINFKGLLLEPKVLTLITLSNYKENEQKSNVYVAKLRYRKVSVLVIWGPFDVAT